MKTYIIISVILLSFISTRGQSVLIEPGKQGINTTTAQSNTLEIQGNGILVQQAYTVSTVNPQSTVIILPNGSTSTTTAESGILKDPNDDNPYLTGTAFNANAYLNLSTGIGIKFTFELLDTEANGDSVIISDNDNMQIARYSGTTLPDELIIFTKTGSVNKYYIKFKTDSDANAGQGFVLRWQTLFANGNTMALSNAGGGSTLLFDRSKSAFRAGNFNKLNLKTLGAFSTALGDRTEASGNFSLAGGYNSKASGYASFAFGYETEATNYAYSFGYYTKSRGYDSFVIGLYNDISNPENSNSPADRIFQIGNGSTTINRKNALTVLRNGRIGVGTTSPNSKLHVYNGSSGVSFSANSSAIFENSSSHYLTLATPEASESGILFSKSTSGDASGGIIYGVNNDLYLRTNGNINRMTIGSTGKVGIGVPNPIKTLDVQSASTDTELQLTSTGNRYSTLSLKSETAGGAEIILKKGTDTWALYNSGSSLNLNYDGNIAFGSVPALNIVVSSEPVSSFKYYTIKPAYNDYTQLGTSINRFREIWSTNALNTSSDRRLKKDISALKYGLEAVMKLQAVSYHWKKSIDSKLHLGFIAQDVEKIVPEIVSKSNISDAEFEKSEKKGEIVTDTYGIEYTGLIPVLVKAIQEQQRIIEGKSLEIDQLREKLQKMSDLEARLNSIEAILNIKKVNQVVKTDK